MGVGADLYMCDVVVKSSRSLSHLLMSSCPTTPYIQPLGSLLPTSIAELSLYSAYLSVCVSMFFCLCVICFFLTVVFIYSAL